MTRLHTVALVACTVLALTACGTTPAPTQETTMHPSIPADAATRPTLEDADPGYRARMRTLGELVRTHGHLTEPLPTFEVSNAGCSDDPGNRMLERRSYLARLRTPLAEKDWPVVLAAVRAEAARDGHTHVNVLSDIAGAHAVDLVDQATGGVITVDTGAQGTSYGIDTPCHRLGTAPPAAF